MMKIYKLAAAVLVALLALGACSKGAASESEIIPEVAELVEPAATEAQTETPVETNEPASEVPAASEEPATEEDPEPTPELPEFAQWDGKYLKNGGVEDLNDDGSVTHWDVWPGNPDEGERKSSSVTDVAHGGERSIRIDLVDGNNQAIYQYRVPGDNPFPFNENYVFSAYVKMEDVESTGVSIGVKRRGADGSENNIMIPVEIGTYDWKLVEISAPAPDAQIVQYDVIFDVGSGSGAIYFDDFELRPMTAEEAAAKPVYKGAYLKNPGVEELNPDGTVTHWDVWPGNPDEGTRVSYASEDIKHSGDRSVCIELVMSNNQAIYQYRVPSDNPFPFNESYVFSAWVKMEEVTVFDGNGVRIGIKRRGADGEEYNLSTHIDMGTFDWKLFELEVPDVDVEIVQYDVIFDIGSGSGKIYFDDFDLKPLD
jgi:hypothetical protein